RGRTRAPPTGFRRRACRAAHLRRRSTLLRAGLRRTVSAGGGSAALLGERCRFVLALQGCPYGVLSRSQYRLIRSGDIREHWLRRLATTSGSSPLQVSATRF